MSLREFCRRQVVTISPRSNIVEACRLMGGKNIGCMLVEEDGKLCGILTDRDIALKVAGERKDPERTRVGEVMTPNPVRISVDEDLHDLASLMHANHVRRMPIVDGADKILGIVTLDDLVALLSDDMSEVGKAVSETFTGAAA